METATLPDIINEEEEYEVEKVQNHRKKSIAHNFQSTRKVMEMSITNR